MKPKDRWKKRVHRKTISGSKIAVKEKKSSKRQCAVCSAVLHGMPHGKRAFEERGMAKTSKRPTALFGGQLCSSCRKNALEDCLQVQSNAKPLDEVDLKLKPYVQQLLKVEA